ncbi:hypothetical protein GCM10017083_25350 [Thalassobaculum fulvum]|uniref:Glycosyl transferases group 1 n=1 Tax=Thalassobaculum fulvum TaxID=1633335 RepID=A0A918XTK1_9PROT|nr:hypothetical protein [Thalassobaculum fulvum]GHD51200.1 hypothetical protein GCM10017083_25350 [Thalassobaculum fulvum]
MSDRSSGRPADGVILVLPTLESNLDPHRLHEVHYDCSYRALAPSGRKVAVVDPRNVSEFQSLLSSDDYGFVVTERSQAPSWPIPAEGSPAYVRAIRKVFITFAGNPPFYEGSFGFHQAAFERKVAVLHDHDSLPYAEAINVSGARLVPGRPMYHDVGLNDEASWLAPSRRLLPILFVGSYTDPESFRAAWRHGFATFPKPLEAIEAAAELLAGSPRLPVWRALEQAVASLDIRFDLRSRAGRTALEMLSRFANHRSRQALLDRVSRYPSRIIATDLPPLPSRHPDCILSPVVSFPDFLNMLKQTACLVTTNPNGMTGSVSERVPNAMRRGAVVLHAPNNNLRRLDDAGIVVLGDSLDDLDACLDSAAARDTRWNALGEAARNYAERHFRMDDMYDALLETAADPGRWRDRNPDAPPGTDWR